MSETVLTIECAEIPAYTDNPEGGVSFMELGL